MHMQTRLTESGRAVFQMLRPQLFNVMSSMPNRERITDAFHDRLLGLFNSQEATDRHMTL
jgi:hypothetical protein